MPRQQHLRHFTVVPDSGLGVLRILQQPIPMAFLCETHIIRQHAGNHAAYCICDRHRRYFAAGEDKITDGDFLIHAFVDKSLVDALIMSTDNDNMLTGNKLPRLALAERRALRTHQDSVNMFAASHMLVTTV